MTDVLLRSASLAIIYYLLIFLLIWNWSISASTNQFFRAIYTKFLLFHMNNNFVCYLCSSTVKNVVEDFWYMFRLHSKLQDLTKVFRNSRQQKFTQSIEKFRCFPLEPCFIELRRHHLTIIYRSCKEHHLKGFLLSITGGTFEKLPVLVQVFTRFAISSSVISDKNSKHLFVFIYNFLYTFSFEKNIISQTHICVRSFLLYKIFWNSIALMAKYVFLLKNLSIPPRYIAIFLSIFVIR